MIDPHENLDQEQLLILEAVTQHRTKQEAADALGIGIATLYRRLRDMELREAIKAAKIEAIEDTSSALQQMSIRAAVALDTIVHSSEAPYPTRVTAASKILDMAYRSHELENVVAEIEELKQAVGIN